MVLKYTVTALLTASLAGCGAIGAIGVPWNRSPPPTPPVPLEQALLPPPAESSGLPPGTGPEVTTFPTDGLTEPLPQPGAVTASVAPSGLGRTDLLGGWTITTAGDSCQLFMTLPSWTGGYRASTRGCNSDLLKSISAWNLDGDQVVLAGQGGAPLAQLQSTGTNRFDGTASGAPLTFYR